MKKKFKLSKSVIFLLIVIFIYLIVFLLNSDYVKLAFNNFLNSISQIAIVLILVFVIMFFVNLFLKPEKVKKHLGHESGIKGWVYTLFVGSFVPMGPPYVVFPLLGDLKKSGMRNSLIVAFLNIRNLQLIFLIVLINYFGLLFTLVLGIYVFIFAILNGVLIEKIL